MNPIKTAFILFGFLLAHVEAICQDSHFGGFYTYGAYFNFHPTNQKLLRPQDGSSAGIYYQLDNGVKALGFRASLAARWNDVQWKINENSYVLNESRSIELKLQCSLRMTNKSSLALGMAPRMVTHSGFGVGYKSSATRTTYEEVHQIPGIKGDLNEINSALSFSWYYDFNKVVGFAMHLDQDMLPAYADVVSVPVCETLPLQEVNVRFTSLTASLILTVR